MPRLDNNHGQIVALLRENGALVTSLAQLGGGVPDLLIGYQGRLALIEVKNGERPAQGRRLTPAEERFHEDWQGYPVYIVYSADDLLYLLAAMQRSA